MNNADPDHRERPTSIDNTSDLVAVTHAREQATLSLEGQDTTSDRPIRVLLGDDHQAVRHSLGLLFEVHSDMELIGEARDGQEVVEMAEAHQPDVVVMDISMPRLDGREATRRIREKLPTATIIGLSGYADDEMRQSVLEAGAATYLCKEQAAEKLIEVIHQISGR